MRALTDTFAAFKLVWVRVACYFLIPFATTFLALTETWSGDTWDKTSRFLIYRMFVSCTVAGLSSFVAFVDSSFQKASAQADALKAKREADTQFNKRSLDT